MTTHNTGTRKQWLAARLELLEKEKELTRRNDELSRQRQQLPWVRVDKDYRFETDEGGASLADLFRGRSQLIAYHFMFGPDYTACCPSCSSIADGFSGIITHLENHDIAMTAVSRAPLHSTSCRHSNGEWAGHSPGHRRSAANSIPISVSVSLRSSNATVTWRTTTGASRSSSGIRSGRMAGRMWPPDWRQ